QSTESLDDLPTDINQENCKRRGLCLVGKDRSNVPYRLYYEIHGSLDGSNKMVHRLNNTCNSWDNQVDHFAKKPDHSVLVFDNRGVGNSETGVREKYKTSEMAKDALELLNFLGWDKERSLHIIGVSMGGMIAQELCLLIPERVRSVAFVSTKAGDKFDLPPLSGLYMLSRLITGTVTEEQRIEYFLNCLFPQHFLDQPHSEGFTQREHYRRIFTRRFKTVRPQTTAGRLGQLGAALGHSCSVFKLKWMNEKLHPAKILVIGGDEDKLINPVRIYELHDFLSGSELVMIKGAGHALGAQVKDQFNETIERIMQEADQIFS
ncbi:Alpha/Beta hydrolase protein, partial [Phakopsora pachyrhizi]